jgi:hypothetical protein
MPSSKKRGHPLLIIDKIKRWGGEKSGDGAKREH